MIIWRDHPDPAFAKKVGEVCSVWDGTPYVQGNSVPGYGADCVGFAVPVGAALAGVTEYDIPRLAPLTSFFNRKKTFQMLIHLKKQFPMYKRVHSNIILPGDIILVTMVNNPGHIMVVSESCNMLWHADYQVGVRKSATPYIKTLYGIWRLRQWLN